MKQLGILNCLLLIATFNQLSFSMEFDEKKEREIARPMTEAQVERTIRELRAEHSRLEELLKPKDYNVGWPLDTTFLGQQLENCKKRTAFYRAYLGCNEMIHN